MASMFQTLFRTRSTPRSNEISRYNLDWYIQQVINNPFGVYGAYSTSTRDGKPVEDVGSSFAGYVQQGYKANGPLFAIVLARLMLFSEARFQFRRLINGRPGDLFGTKELEILEHPWPNGTTGELLARMEQDVSLAGNAYVIRDGDRLRRLRPDWVSIVLTGDPSTEGYVDVAGYVYHPGGTGDPVPYLPEEICHWSPIPDPEAQYRGMSWVTPIVRELQADDMATRHKESFFRNGAKPGLVVSLKESVKREQFLSLVKAMNESHQGAEQAYKTLFLAGGADVTVAGANMQQLEFRATQGAGETRMCAAGGVPPIIVGLSEGLSSATYSNYAMARRKFGDHWARPQWRSACAALSMLLTVPGGAELWYDDRDIAFLREDQKDAAEIAQVRAATINSYIINGFTPESAVAAVMNSDESMLIHTGLVSVQLQPPGAGVPETDPALAGETPPPDATTADTTAGSGDLQALNDALDAVSARAGYIDAEEALPALEAGRSYNPAQIRDWHGRWSDMGGGGKPKIAEFAAVTPDQGRKDELRALAAKVYEGEFGGLHTKVTKAYSYGKSKPDWVTVEGTIHDSSGKKIGTFERLLDRDQQGRRYAYHQSLELDPAVRGQGFSEAFNREAERWYRDNGVEYIGLNANIDVGGYAWARSGYTWADEETRDDVFNRLADKAEEYEYDSYTATDPAERADLQHQADAARALVKRFHDAKTPDDIPTPYEVSEVGRPPGAKGRDATWVGKDALLGSDWEGVKWL